MPNYLDANPDIANDVRTHRALGQFVPVASGGELAIFINHRDIERLELTAPLSAEDYVVGMELLGWSFDALEQADGTRSLSVGFPTEQSPDAWDTHASNIAKAFGQDRHGDVFAYVALRDGVQKMPSAEVVRPAFGTRPRPAFDDGGPNHAA